MKEELRLIKQAIGTLQRAVAIMEDRLDVETPKKQNGFKPPAHMTALDYHTQKEYRFDFDKWWNHYTTNGWKIGKVSMKDWYSCMAQWESRHKEKEPHRVEEKLDACGRPIKDNGTRSLL